MSVTRERSITAHAPSRKQDGGKSQSSLFPQDVGAGAKAGAFLRSRLRHIAVFFS